jgi:hypothetical protein
MSNLHNSVQGNRLIEVLHHTKQPSTKPVHHYENGKKLNTLTHHTKYDYHVDIPQEWEEERVDITNVSFGGEYDAIIKSSHNIRRNSIKIHYYINVAWAVDATTECFQTGGVYLFCSRQEVKLGNTRIAENYPHDKINNLYRMRDPDRKNILQAQTYCGTAEGIRQAHAFTANQHFIEELWTGFNNDVLYDHEDEESHRNSSHLLRVSADHPLQITLKLDQTTNIVDLNGGALYPTLSKITIVYERAKMLEFNEKELIGMRLIGQIYKFTHVSPVTRKFLLGSAVTELVLDLDHKTEQIYGMMLSIHSKALHDVGDLLTIAYMNLVDELKLEIGDYDRIFYRPYVENLGEKNEKLGFDPSQHLFVHFFTNKPQKSRIDLVSGYQNLKDNQFRITVKLSAATGLDCYVRVSLLNHAFLSFRGQEVKVRK